MTESNFFRRIIFRRVCREAFLSRLRILYSINFIAQVYFGCTLSTDPHGQFISNAVSILRILGNNAKRKRNQVHGLKFWSTGHREKSN